MSNSRWTFSLSAWRAGSCALCILFLSERHSATGSFKWMRFCGVVEHSRRCYHPDTSNTYSTLDSSDFGSASSGLHSVSSDLNALTLPLILNEPREIEVRTHAARLQSKRCFGVRPCLLLNDTALSVGKKALPFVWELHPRSIGISTDGYITTYQLYMSRDEQTRNAVYHRARWTASPTVNTE